jgi:aminopeptidase N
MSTYLIAFIVSDYKGSTENTNKFGVFARPEAQAHTEYAVEFGIKMLDKLNEYFGIDYYSVLSKMDMAAIPDFSAGGRKNSKNCFFLLSK